VRGFRLNSLALCPSPTPCPSPPIPSASRSPITPAPSHAVFLKDSEPLDLSFRRILESPTYLPIHVRSIADTQNLENDIANTKPVQGEVQLKPGLLAAIIIITSIVLLGLLFIGLFGFDRYLSYRKKVEMKKQQEEESSNNAEDAERKEMIQKGEWTEIDVDSLLRGSLQSFRISSNLTFVVGKQPTILRRLQAKLCSQPNFSNRLLFLVAFQPVGLGS